MDDKNCTAMVCAPLFPLVMLNKQGGAESVTVVLRCHRHHNMANFDRLGNNFVLLGADLAEGEGSVPSSRLAA